MSIRAVARKSEVASSMLSRITTALNRFPEGVRSQLLA